MKFKPKGWSIWAIFIIDICITIFSLFIAYWLRFNFRIPDYEIKVFPIIFPTVILLRILSFIIFRTYSGIIKHTSTEDAQRIFIAIAFTTVILGSVNFIVYQFQPRYFIPFSVLIIDFIITVFSMSAFRLINKILYYEIKNTKKEKVRVLIYGAGEGGLTTKRTLEKDMGTNYKIIGFVDDNRSLQNKSIEGIRIYETTKKLEPLLKENDIDLLIISIFTISHKRKKDIVDTCLKHKVKVLHIPPMRKWINGELSFNQIKQVRIEDLLGREAIKLDKQMLKAQVTGAKVLITGAAGSIGSEMVRQLIKFNPAQLILLDQAETPLYELEVELREKYDIGNYELVIGDIRNKERMENVFKTFTPDIVYHAAAYKHVPMMENNPSEAILTNVLGTKITADLAVKYKAKKFVLVSTDKAVNPTNVMGASKRVAEIYVQSLDRCLDRKGEEHTKFITTRFGNVLGSNGSVIPLFRKQIEMGGPITVTHPEVTRFFMTIPEACQLVLEAGALGNGGEIYIFDMGESVKIVDLARKMVKLSGLELGKDIQLVFTGLRPGEKLYEELLNTQEDTVPTHHEKIMIAKVREYEYEEVDRSIKELISLFYSQDNFKIVTLMKYLVPEFKSNNSVFESLDMKEIPA